MNGHRPPPSPEGRHRYTVRVYYEDTDAGGIVYHANYLASPSGRAPKPCATSGVPHAELVARFNLMFVVRRIKMDYLRPARLDDWLMVETEPVRVGGASVTLRQEFAAGGRGSGRWLVVGVAARLRRGRGTDGAMPARDAAQRWRERAGRR